MTRNCVFIACMLVLFCPALWSDQALSTKEKELSKLQETIKQVDKDISGLQTEKKELLRQLKVQEQQYGKIASTVKSLEADIKKHQSSIKDIVDQAVIVRNSMHSQKNQLERLIKAAYAMGDKERLKVVLNQQDPAQYNRILVYYDYLNKSRAQKLQVIKNNFHLLKQLEGDERQKSEKLAFTLEKSKSEQIELQNVRTERNKILAKIEKQFSSKKSQLESLKLNEKKLKQLILSLQRNSEDFPFQDGPVKPFAQLKGRLPWPVTGQLIKKFGSPRSESRWDGVLINAREGLDIHAVTRGRVVYADWLRGYGLLTIIDHGKGYMTLYAFNQSLYRTKGDWVEAGDVIASVGKSGGRSKAALYFGIRKQGKSVNPVHWCRKVQNGRVG